MRHKCTCNMTYAIENKDNNWTAIEKTCKPSKQISKLDPVVYFTGKLIYSFVSNTDNRYMPIVLCF
ncbi:unnamed protein product, partial [Vitis vinifera]